MFSLAFRASPKSHKREFYVCAQETSSRPCHVSKTHVLTSYDAEDLQKPNIEKLWSGGVVEW
jgi:hypothetical protein